MSPALLTAFFSTSLLLGCAPEAAPVSEASSAPEAAPVADGASFAHDDWAAVLGRFVDENGMVDYRGLAADRAGLDEYVDRVRRIGPETNPELFPTREHEFAYYINAYNALVFDGVLSRGPEEKSVWSGLISGFNFFRKMKVRIEGNQTNLQDLENEIIRKRYEDARLHAALNCASIGCPRLPQEPFVAERLEEQLQAAMAEFLNDERHVTVDSAKGRVTLSKIFDWFREDFIADEKRNGNSDPVLLDYVNRFRASDGQIPRDYKVDFAPYDKRINKQ